MAVQRKKRTKQARLGTRAAPRRGYHHGNLREALITAALRVIEDDGISAVTMRDVARRAGVSSGAPFRHFPNRDALLAAVAAEAQRRFRSEIAAAFEKVKTDDPLVRLRALGDAYIAWAVKNPVHFQVISTRSAFDFAEAPALRQDNDEVIGLTEKLLHEAGRRGQLRFDDVQTVKIAARALVYGLARMYVDGHLPRWGAKESDIIALAEKTLDLFMAGIRRDDSRSKARR